MIMRLCAVGLLTAVLGLLISEGGRGLRGPIITVGAVVILSLVFERISTLTSGLFSLASGAGVEEICSAAMKVVGAGYVFGICSDICRELDAPLVANALTVGGRAEIILIVMPYFIKTVSLGVEMLK